MAAPGSAPAPASLSYPAAELDRRFYAFAVDRLIAWGLFAAGVYLAWSIGFRRGDTGLGIVVIAVVVVVVSAAYAVLLGLAGISPGKALVGLRVVRHFDGRPPGLGAALLRTLVLGAAALPTLGIGLATLAWTALSDPGGWRRGRHDHWTHVAVVDVRPVPVEVEEAEDRPRQIVNLTAMRLMPSPPPGATTAAATAPTPTPTPTPAPSTPSLPAAMPTSGPSNPPGPPASARPTPVSPSATPAARPTLPPAPPRPPSRPAPTPAAAGPPMSPPSSVPVHPVAAAPTSPPVGAPPGPPPPGSGAGSHRRTPVPASAAAPSAVEAAGWRVSFDTGESLLVQGLALVGRRPEARPGEPVRHLIPLRSTDMSLSKTHAQFQVVPDGALVIMDRGSTNGSSIVRGGVSKPLNAGRPATLLDGDTVRLGDRTMQVSRTH